MSIIDGLTVGRQEQLWYYPKTMSLENIPSQALNSNSEYAQRLDRVIDYIRGNLDRQVKLQELAKVACFSEYHFHRIFGAIAGETVNNFTNRLRLEKAMRLLRYSDQNLTEIALDCGFHLRPHFREPFELATILHPGSFEKAGKSKKARFAKKSRRDRNMFFL